MNDKSLIAELRFLGIDKDSHRVVILLPLIQVAWADGTVQSAERALILDIAEKHRLLGSDGGRILEGWLMNAPTHDYLERGRRCLIALAARAGHDLGDSLNERTLAEVLEMCERVAEASGGLFGLLWSVDEQERAAITEIAAALHVEKKAGEGWEEAPTELS